MTPTPHIRPPRFRPRPLPRAVAAALVTRLVLGGTPACAQEIAVSEEAESAPAAAAPVTGPWQLFLPDAYQPGSRYPCLILLHEPALDPATLARQIRPFFHQAARAGILIAVPVASTAPHARRSLLPDIAIESLLADPAVAPGSLSLVATGNHALPSLNLLLSRPGQIGAAGLVRPQTLPLDPSPLWPNLAATPILLALDPAQPAQASWADRLTLFGGESLRLRRLQSSAADVDPLAGLAGEILKFLLAPAADPGPPPTFELVAWRVSDGACWWVDRLLPADPAQPLRIAAASHSVQGIQIRTQNLDSFRLLPPPAHARPATLLTPIQVDNSRLDTWHPADGLILVQRPGDRWATATQTRSPARAATPPPHPSVHTLTEALHRAALANGLPPNGRVEAQIPTALLALLDELAKTAQPQPPPASSDLWLDIFEGLRLDLAATPLASPARAYPLRRLVVPETLAEAAAIPTWYAEIHRAGPDPLAPAVKGSGNAGPRLLAALLRPDDQALVTESAPAPKTSPARPATPAPLTETDLHRLVPR